jgi:hypothetical protein
MALSSMPDEPCKLREASATFTMSDGNKIVTVLVPGAVLDSLEAAPGGKDEYVERCEIHRWRFEDIARRKYAIGLAEQNNTLIRITSSDLEF